MCIVQQFKEVERSMCFPRNRHTRGGMFVKSSTSVSVADVMLSHLYGHLGLGTLMYALPHSFPLPFVSLSLLRIILLPSPFFS